MDLIFKDVNVSINSVSILKNVSGMAKQGEMLAVMGPSGAGKSTLLNALSARLPVESGHITLNGEPISRKLRRKICYVLQNDVFFANLTLRQTLTYTAMLRLPDKMTKKMKQQQVDEIIDLLDLRKCANTVMGGMFIPGLSGGEKKRASIASELITNPSLIMLDEPTSGLDSAIALNLMRTMKKYTEESNKTVITTIHQPSSQIFHFFDNILLLANGEVAYFGKTCEILDFFNRIQMPCIPNYNPADFILEKVKEGEEVLKKILTAADAMRETDTWPEELRRTHDKLALEYELPKITSNDKASSDLKINGGNQHMSLAKRKSSASDDEAEKRLIEATPQPNMDDKRGMNGLEPAHINVEIVHHSSRQAIESHNIDDYYIEGAKWQTTFCTQYSTLVQRSFNQAKTRILSKLNIGQTLVISIFCGVIWFQTPRIEATLKDRMGLVFFMVVYFGFMPMFDAITSFPEERGVITKERAAGSYRLTAYYLSKMTSESPLTFALPLVFCTIIYWMGGLTVDAGSFLAMLFLILFQALVSQSIGIFIGVTFLDFKLSVTVAACFMLTSLLAGGYYQSNFPFWMEWARYISFLHYAFSAAMKIEFLRGPNITCSTPETSKFEQCALNLTTQISGKEVLDLDGHSLPIWVDILALLTFAVLFRVLGYIVLRYIRRPGGMKCR